jgi:hypothetical protein
MIGFLLFAAAPAGSGGGKGSPLPFFIGLIAVGLVSIFARQMWNLNKWRYANPDAVRPSATYFTFERVFGFIALAAGVVGLIVVIASQH